MPYGKKVTGSDADTVVISFRAPRGLVKQLDEIAEGDQRTRTNFIVRMLTQAVSLEPGIQIIEQILPALVREHERNPDSLQAERFRAEMRGARAAISAFFGKRAIRWINLRVKERTKLPMPHVVPLEQDGYRYGIDSEADLL